MGFKSPVLCTRRRRVIVDCAQVAMTCNNNGCKFNLGLLILFNPESQKKLVIYYTTSYLNF